MKEPNRSFPKQELLVFGYPCKLYKNEDKPGGSKDDFGLIPLNGNKNILIDRYDCRLHLQNHERYKERADSKWLSEADSELEEVLNVERYRDLVEVSSEENEDKGRKRAEIFYDYNTSSSADPTVQEAATCEDDAFVVPSELKVPKGVVVPKNSKQHKIIEKTASFIATHGSQMEIIVNIKQKGNPFFRFLDYSHQLHVYYKHVLRMIKEKRYTPSVEKIKIDKIVKEELNDEEDSDDSCDYLHPSLRGSGKTFAAENSRPTTSIPMPQIDYCLGKENDVYSDLYKGLVAIFPELASSKSKIQTEGQSEQASNEQHSNEAVSDNSLYSMGGENAKHLVVVPPPPDLQPTIDRLAEYVARNGREFENIVRTKRDPRFSFIMFDNPYYSYYKAKVQWFQYEDLIARYYQGTLTAADMNTLQMSHYILFPGKPIVEVEKPAGATSAPVALPSTAAAEQKDVAKAADSLRPNGAKEVGEVIPPSSAENAPETRKPQKVLPISFSIKSLEKQPRSSKVVLPQLSENEEEEEEEEEEVREEEEEEGEKEEVIQGTSTSLAASSSAISCATIVTSVAKHPMDRSKTELIGSSEGTVADDDESVHCLLDSISSPSDDKKASADGNESLQLDRRKRAKLFLNKLTAKTGMDEEQSKGHSKDDGICVSDSPSTSSDRCSAEVGNKERTKNAWRAKALPSSYEKHRHSSKRKRSRSRTRSRHRDSKSKKRSRSRSKCRHKRSHYRYS
ncbi:splicing factor, arginine:serine rich 8 [Trichuris trichiura]|uniref:Splicing factor, arginine:serine rich 8 n=1 Tax=Trichuris trichiura TaxID=36087 RepID=A0A077Z755_TRITR|nr:splicing factor, arginine:serine rich 8 [Trichuris trichiura]